MQLVIVSAILWRTPNHSAVCPWSTQWISNVCWDNGYLHAGLCGEKIFQHFSTNVF